MEIYRVKFTHYHDVPSAPSRWYLSKNIIIIFQTIYCLLQALIVRTTLNVKTSSITFWYKVWVGVRDSPKWEMLNQKVKKQNIDDQKMSKNVSERQTKSLRNGRS